MAQHPHLSGSAPRDPSPTALSRLAPGLPIHPFQNWRNALVCGPAASGLLPGGGPVRHHGTAQPRIDPEHESRVSPPSARCVSRHCGDTPHTRGKRSKRARGGRLVLQITSAKTIAALDAARVPHPCLAQSASSSTRPVYYPVIERVSERPRPLVPDPGAGRHHRPGAANHADSLLEVLSPRATRNEIQTPCKSSNSKTCDPTRPFTVKGRVTSL
jgi:hypothetical protein